MEAFIAVLWIDLLFQMKCVSAIVDEEPEVCEEYAIEYYPTVIMFKKRKVHKLLDAESGIGLNKRQLKELTEER